jgi:hypothetical protein
MTITLYLKNQVPLIFEGEDIRLLKRECDYDLQTCSDVKTDVFITRITFAVTEFQSIIWDPMDFPELKTKDSR